MQNGPDVWLVRRPGKGLLGGMRALPTSDWTGEPGYAPPLAGEWKRLARPVSHVFTHFALNLHVEWRHVERACMADQAGERSAEPTSEHQSLIRNSSACF